MSGSRATEGIDVNEARINRVLAAAYQREKATQQHVSSPMTIGAVLQQAPGDGEDELLIKSETVIRMLGFVFQDGPHPGSVMRLVYLLAQRIKPDLILNMSGAEMADIFGETRAAWSARNQRIFTNYLRGQGQKAHRAWMQRSDATREKLAAASRGNTNRRNSGRGQYLGR